MFDGLPQSPADLADAAATVLLHFAVAPGLGIAVPAAARGDVSIRTLEATLRLLRQRNAAGIGHPRPAADKFFGSCRHYALLTAAILRHRGIAARLRVGFADYFQAGILVDHWLCEYDSDSGWQLLDAELDRPTRQRLGLTFPAHEVPRARFRVAAQVWHGLRAGEIDPDRVGVPEIGVTGLWFAAASLMRDATALGMIELLPWDYWGPARDFAPGCRLDDATLQLFDRLAEDLSAEPPTPGAALDLQRRHPWITVSPTVLAYPEGVAVEQPILPG